MNVSKTLAAVIAATSIVGAVGLAYAQTTTETPVVPANPTTAMEPSTQAPAEGSQGTQSGATPAPSTGTVVTPSASDSGAAATSTATPATTDSEVASEPMPKADRN